MLRIYIGAMRIKRTIRIRYIHPATPLLISHNVDSSAKSVSTQFNRHNPFVNFNALC